MMNDDDDDDDVAALVQVTGRAGQLVLQLCPKAAWRQQCAIHKCNKL
jgi:hypothetical protein